MRKSADAPIGEAVSQLPIFDAQITERGFPVAEVSRRLGVSQHSLCAWRRMLSKASSGEVEKDAEIGRLKRELTPVTEERDIPK